MTDDYDHARSLAIAERRWLVDARARLRSTRTTRVVRVTRLVASTADEQTEGPR